MYQRYRDRAEFLFVYIREAHPSDEWQLDVNERDSVVIAQPASFDERREVAQVCTRDLLLTMPCAVDDMSDTVDNAYAAWPERLFVVDTHGRIAYAGGQGPFGFEPGDLAEWLGTNLGPPK